MKTLSEMRNHYRPMGRASHKENKGSEGERRMGLGYSE